MKYSISTQGILFSFKKEGNHQRVINKMNPKMITPRHIIIKMAKVKGKERVGKGETRQSQNETLKAKAKTHHS